MPHDPTSAGPSWPVAPGDHGEPGDGGSAGTESPADSPAPGAAPPPAPPGGGYAPGGPYPAPGSVPAEPMAPGHYAPPQQQSQQQQQQQQGGYAAYPPPGYPPYGGYAPPGSQPPMPPGQPVPPPGQPVPGQVPPGQVPPLPPPGAAGHPYGPYPQQPYWPYGPPPPPPRVRTPQERRRRLRRGLLAAGALVVLAGAGIGLGLWLAPTPPATVARSLATQAIAAGNAAGSFRYVQRSTEDGVRDDIAGVAGPDSGQQLITERGATGLDVFHLRLVHGVVYFRGNAPAVVDQLGVPASRASTVAGEWVSVHKGTGPYTSFAVGITTRSNLSQLPTTFVATSSQAGSAVTTVFGGLNAGKGRAPVGAAQLVIGTSSSLPRTFEAKAVNGAVARLRLSWRFSRWGAPVHMAVPSGAVPYSSLGATPPSSKR